MMKLNTSSIVIILTFSAITVLLMSNFMIITDLNNTVNIDTTLKPVSGKLEYVHITKTGGSSIEMAGSKWGISWGACHFLFDLYDENKPCPKDVKWDVVSFTNSRFLANGTKREGPDWHVPPRFWTPNYMSNKDTFTVVRNPYDRAVSEYYNPWNGYKGKNPNNPNQLNSWIQRLIRRKSDIKDGRQYQFLLQYEYVFDEHGNQIVDHVLKFENLISEFNALMEKYSLQPRLSEHERVYERDKSQKLTAKDFNAYTIRSINKYARKDFHMFGYTLINPT